MFLKKKTYSIFQLPLNSGNLAGKYVKKNSIVNSFDIASQKDIWFTKTKAQSHFCMSLLFIILASTLLNSTSLFVQKLSYISPGFLTLARNAGIFSGSLPIAVYKTGGIIVSKKDILSVSSKSFISGIAVYFNVLAFQYLPLSDATIIMSSTPVVSTVIARIYLREHCAYVESLALMATFCGVLMPVDNSQRNNVNSTYFIGLACAVGCVLVRSFIYVALRTIKDIHFSVALLYFSVFGFIENAIINFITKSIVYPYCGWDNALIMLIGIIGFMGHCILVLGIYLQKDGIVLTVKGCFDILISFILQTLFCSEDIDVNDIIGASLVILPLIMTGVSTWLLTLPENSTQRKKLKWFLK